MEMDLWFRLEELVTDNFAMLNLMTILILFRDSKMSLKASLLWSQAINVYFTIDIFEFHY